MIGYILAAVAGLLLVDSKVKSLPIVSKYNPLGTKLTNPDIAHPGAPAAPVPANIPGNLPGTGRVDGKGTGVIAEPIVAATAAAEAMKLQVMNAVNTPEGDRSPEQLALLSTLGSLPT